MNALNLKVITATCEWLAKGERVFFVTVLSTWGASPRPAGSLLAYNVDSDIQVGSLSGGCIEDDLFAYLKALSQETAFTLPSYLTKTYGESEADGARYLLPCGGTLSLLIEPVDNTAHQHFYDLKEALLSHQMIARTVIFDELHARKYSLIRDKDNLGHEELRYSKVPHQLYHRLDPVYKLLLVGVGDVALYLSDMAESLGFDVTLCEPRAPYKQRFQTDNLPYKVSDTLPDDLIRSDFSDSFSAILCLAHDPKLDDMALMEALSNSAAFYIGAMGSLKTSQMRCERLKSLDITPQQLLRLHAPIGLSIHSKTPQEIAISICAELISFRYRHKSLSS